jgi:hypothetical protein
MRQGGSRCSDALEGLAPAKNNCPEMCSDPEFGRKCALTPNFLTPNFQVASWKMMPSVCRCPLRTRLTPCRMLTR